MGKVVLAIVIASLGITACDAQCKKSADVLLEVDGDDAVLAQVGSVALSVAVGDGAVQPTPLVMTGPLETGATILLSAEATPNMPTYSVAISASLRNDAGVEIATGTVTATVGSHACNHVRLSVVAVANDMSAPIDTASAPLDLPLMVDLAPDLACVPNGFDEDDDGLSDPCDVCAATADPGDIDTDGDGVPDKCDPAITVPGNKVTLFEPFNTTPAWTGTPPMVSGGQLVLDGTTDCAHYDYDPGSIGPSVQLQTYVTPTAMSSAKTIDEVGLFVLDANNPTRGMACLLQLDGTVRNLVLSQGPIFTDPNSLGTQPTQVSAMVNPGQYAVNVQRKLVLTVSGPSVSCELLGPTGVLVKMLSTTTLFMPTELQAGVGVCYASATFSSVFGVSAP